MKKSKQEPNVGGAKTSGCQTKLLVCSNALICYFDLLGYGAAIYREPTALEAKRIFACIEEGILFFKKLPSLSNYAQIQQIDSHLRFDMYSDSFILVFDQWPFLRSIGKTGRQIYALNVFGYLISSLVHYFLYSLGFLARGAIVMGQCYHRRLSNSNGSFIYSKGLCNAYGVAETLARLP